MFTSLVPDLPDEVLHGWLIAIARLVLDSLASRSGTLEPITGLSGSEQALVLGNREHDDLGPPASFDVDHLPELGHPSDQFATMYPRLGRAASRLRRLLLERLQGLFDVGDDVGRVLQAHREPEDPVAAEGAV